MISLYWDKSHIWGFLVWHSLKSLGVPFELLTNYTLYNNKIKNPLLIMPGGSARMKEKQLGSTGKDILLKYVANGGNYLGFCGGSGFALSSDYGLCLCDWEREPIKERILHHISGHLEVDITEHFLYQSITEKPCLPVWFPSRFKEKETENLLVLARYKKASYDFYLSDIPLFLFSEESENNSLQELYDVYGISLDPQVEGEPTTILGKFHKGEYILSYAHLETPASAFANKFYCNILNYFTSSNQGVQSIPLSIIPELDLINIEVLWEDTFLEFWHKELEKILILGIELKLLFHRTSWLIGWKQGVQGMQLANLRIVLVLLRTIKPNIKMLHAHSSQKEEINALFKLFIDGVRSWFYIKRLSGSMPECVPLPILKDQQERLFGKAMELGGICGELVEKLENIFLMQDS